MRRARAVAAIDYCDPTHTGALFDAKRISVQMPLKHRQIPSFSRNANSSFRMTKRNVRHDDCYQHAIASRSRNSSELRLTRSTRRFARCAVCKLNLRDMGATSSEGYSHTTVGLSKGGRDNQTVAHTDVTDICFSISRTVASGERFAEALRFDAGNAGVSPV